jgi:hypothetical protein
MTDKNSTQLRRLCRAHGLSIPALAAQLNCSGFASSSLRLMECGKYPLYRIKQAPEPAQVIERGLQRALGTDLRLIDLLMP